MSSQPTVESQNRPLISVGQPSFGGNERSYVLDCLERGWLTAGHYVKRFEHEFAEFVGVRHAITTTSGTTALTLALAALDIEPGDEVIVPALTFVATANAVRHVGAKPVIVDVDPDTWTISEDAIRQYGSLDTTRAVIPVHLYGAVAPMKDYGFTPARIIEDACEAIGAEYHMTRAGALGDMGCFSFYGNKTITTGEGGMVTTDDDALATKLRLLRSEYSRADRYYWHEQVGYNFNMTDMQAAVGCGQMEALQGILEWRAEVAAHYRAELDNVMQFQQTPDGCKHGNWAVVGLLPTSLDRDQAMVMLREAGIETRPMFYPLNTLPMYKDNPRCPVAERIAPRGLVLPTHAELTPDDVSYICDTLKTLIRNNSRRANLR